MFHILRVLSQMSGRVAVEPNATKTNTVIYREKNDFTVCGEWQEVYREAFSVFVSVDLVRLFSVFLNIEVPFGKPQRLWQSDKAGNKGLVWGTMDQYVYFTFCFIFLAVIFAKTPQNDTTVVVFYWKSFNCHYFAYPADSKFYTIRNPSLHVARFRLSWSLQHKGPLLHENLVVKVAHHWVFCSSCTWNSILLGDSGFFPRPLKMFKMFFYWIKISRL